MSGEDILTDFINEDDLLAVFDNSSEDFSLSTDYSSHSVGDDNSIGIYLRFPIPNHPINMKLDDFVRSFLESDSLEELSEDESCRIDRDLELNRDINEIVNISNNGALGSSQLSLIKKVSRRKQKIPASIPVEKIPLSEFLRNQSAIARAFNTGNLQTIVSIVNRLNHRKSIFKMKNPLETIEAIGPDNIITFYGALLHVYPDAILLSKKTKTFQQDKFQVIQSKFDFSGTESNKTYAKQIFCPNPNENYMQADFMVASPEEKAKYYELERKIESCGMQTQIFIKAVYTQYLDPESNRVVYSEVSYRVSSIKAV